MNPVDEPIKGWLILGAWKTKLAKTYLVTLSLRPW